jgi:amidase
MSRTVSDAVYVLDVIAGFDPQDYEATKEAAKYIPVGGYKQFLNPDGLNGKRLGVVRNLFSSSLNKSSVIQAFERYLNTMRYKNNYSNPVILCVCLIFFRMLLNMYSCLVDKSP